MFNNWHLLYFHCLAVELRLNTAYVSLNSILLTSLLGNIRSVIDEGILDNEYNTTILMKLLMTFKMGKERRICLPNLTSKIALLVTSYSPN
jgi:hypothetical protein